MLGSSCPPLWAQPCRLTSAPIQIGANGEVHPFGERRVCELELYRVLGRNGLFSVGLGGVGRSSPYAGDNAGVFQPLPAITYNGSRLQWSGPSLRYGLVGTDERRLAATASYRIRAYEEEDSSARWKTQSGS
jgi:outer membrane scaffolding protein for murein synthesis (MipA/OmpV family)